MHVKNDDTSYKYNGILAYYNVKIKKFYINTLFFYILYNFLRYLCFFLLFFTYNRPFIS